jgi:ATP-binding cassette, subfamily B, bacterial
MKKKKRPQNVKQGISGINRIVKHFLPQISSEGKLLTISFLALLAETGLHMLEPWPLKFIFDEIIFKQFKVESLKVPFLDTFNVISLLTFLAVALVIIAVLRGSMAYVSTAGMAVAATRIMSEIRANLYSHIQSLSLSFHNKAKSGDLITRVTYDIERLREVTVVAALPLLTNILTMMGMLGVMFWLNLELALIAVIIFPLFLITTATMSQRIHQVAQKQRQREGVMAATAAEAIGAIKVVQALSLESKLQKTFAKQNQKSLNESAQTQKLRAGQERTVEVLVAIATSSVLWRGVQLVMQGALTPGDLLVFITYLKVAFKPMRQLAKYTGQIAKAIASGERIVDLLEIVPEVRDLRGAYPAPAFQGKVEFQNVTFAYEKQHNLLNKLCLTVEPGQKVALVGASGGGKSTLVKLLLRLYDPVEGSISIDGHDLREYTLDSLRKQISIVLQESILFATTIRDNIAYGCINATEEDIDSNLTLGSRVRLNFDTSFYGEDRLRTRLQSTNLPLTDEAAGTSMARLSFRGDDDSEFSLSRLEYAFPVGERVEVYLEGIGGSLNDYTNTFNDDLSGSSQGSISRFGQRNPIYRQGDGAGIGISYEISDAVSLDVGFVADEANEPEIGLGNAAYGAIAQLSLEPTDSLGIGLTYVHSYNSLDTGVGSQRANDPFDENSEAISADSLGLQSSWELNSDLTLGGWFGFTRATAEDISNQPSASIVNWAVTLAFRDLGAEGNLGGIVIGQPNKAIDNDFTVENNEYIDPNNSLHLEAFYRLKVTDNIEVTPGFFVITNPEHNQEVVLKM